MKALENRFFHTAIIGGGAAGLFCAGSFSAPKILLESSEHCARKVRISGGGKCNFSNRLVSANDYLSKQKHFCKSALSAFHPDDFINLLNQHAIPWEERTQGRLFARNAEEIVRFLITRAQKAHTQITCGVHVLDVQPQTDGFRILTEAGTLHAQHVVLATGGLSYPALGANPFGWNLAQKLGLQVIEPSPVLCGLQLPKNKRSLFSVLAGNSIRARVTCAKHTFEDQLLFTHEGFSGPAILQISLFWKAGQEIEINFLPFADCQEIFKTHKTKNQLFSAVLGDYFPGKVAKTLLTGKDVSLANATKAELAAAYQMIHHFRFVPHGTAGYTKAEATAGGIATTELHAATLQTRRFPCLYAIGELVDVTGRLGGFNLHWAWSSAFAAAQDLARHF